MHLEQPLPRTLGTLPEATRSDIHRHRITTQQQVHEIRRLLLEAADLLTTLDPDRFIDLEAGEVREASTDGDVGAQALGQAAALTAAAQFKMRKVGELLDAPMLDHPSIWAKGRP